MNQSKISNHQLFALVALFTMGTTIIAISSGVAVLAKQDAWISALFSPIIGLLFIGMYYYLGTLYPGKTLVEILLCVFGKWFGWIISAFFVLFVCLMNAAQVVSYVGEFIKTEYMTETPSYALNLLMVASLVIGLLYGIEAIARSSEVFMPIVILIIVLIMLLNISNIKTDNLFPIFENGIAPTLKGSLYLSSYMTWSIIVMCMVYPAHVNDTSKARNSLFGGYLLGAGINFLCTIMSILVLGSNITAWAKYPTYMLVREANIDIITRIEGFISGAWIITQFAKTIIYFYAGAVGLSQLLGIKDFKKIVLPLGLVILVFSGIDYRNVAFEGKWDSTTWIPFIGSFGAILPIILIIITAIKKKLAALPQK